MKKLAILLVIFFSVTLVPGCSNDSEEEKVTIIPAPTATQQPVVFTIGNLSDITGASSNAIANINIAMDDFIEYYNENNLIPGVRLNVITYDGQVNPTLDIPGYEWLIERGADLIFSPIPATPTTLKPRVDKDKVVLFALSATEQGFLPPGYVFNLGVDSRHEAYTIMKWIADNDWDYTTNGPAKIGGAAWSESYSDELLAAIEDYCAVHPDQFEWVGGYLTHFSLNWQAEVEALKDCDYVYPGIVMNSFVKQYREAGYTKATFIGSDTQAAFFAAIDAAELWDEIDGMLFLKTPRWWNEEGEMINLVKQLLHENHPNQANEIIRSGNGYLVMNQLYPMFSIIADAAEAVGPQNIDSQALYDAATSFTLTIDGAQRFSFGEDKRRMIDMYGVYEARGAEKDIFRLHDEWYPTVRNL